MSPRNPPDPNAPPPRKKAAALRYEAEKDGVPRVVARGEGQMADKIIQIAMLHGITVQEDPDLVDMLCKLEVNQLIPEKMFTAVAEVMAYVYRLNNRAKEVQKILKQ